MKEFKGNILANTILEKLKPYTCFPAILLETQCKKHGKTTETLTNADLPLLAEAIEKAIAAFGNPQKGTEAKKVILELVV